MEKEQAGYVLRSAIAHPSQELLGPEMRMLASMDPRPVEIRFSRPAGHVGAVFIEIIRQGAPRPSTDEREPVGLIHLDAQADKLATIIHAHIPDGAVPFDLRLVLSEDPAYDIYKVQ